RVRNTGGRYPKTAFGLDFTTGQLTCPAGVTMAFQPGATVHFPTATCAACPLRARCTTSSHGRSVSIHPDEPLLPQLRHHQPTPTPAQPPDPQPAPRRPRQTARTGQGRARPRPRRPLARPPRPLPRHPQEPVRPTPRRSSPKPPRHRPPAHHKPLPTGSLTTT